VREGQFARQTAPLLKAKNIGSARGIICQADYPFYQKPKDIGSARGVVQLG